MAAATTLNNGSKPPVLLAQAFYELGQLEEAKKYAEESLSRNMDYGPAKSILAKIESAKTKTS